MHLRTYSFAQILRHLLKYTCFSKHVQYDAVSNRGEGFMVRNDARHV